MPGQAPVERSFCDHPGRFRTQESQRVVRSCRSKSFKVRGYNPCLWRGGGSRMDVDEGFILGIYNYCDRWCETCRFTSRCRVFADGAEYDAASTPELKELSRTPQHPSDVRPTPGWLEEILAEVNDQDLPELPVPPPMPGHLRRLSALSGAYCDHAWAAIAHDDARESRPPDDPRSIIL